MITIRTGGYTSHELRVLLATMKEVHYSTSVAHECEQNQCETCTIRHLCGDILRAKEHAQKLVEGSKKRKRELTKLSPIIPILYHILCQKSTPKL